MRDEGGRLSFDLLWGLILSAFFCGSILVFLALLAPLAVQYLFLVLSASWRFVLV